MFLLAAMVFLSTQDSATGSPDLQTRDFLELVPRLVQVGVEYADSTRDTSFASAKLAINVESFAVIGSMTVYRDISSKAISDAVGRPFVEGSPAALDASLYVELNCLSRDGRGYTAEVTSKWIRKSKRVAHPLGFIRVRVFFELRNGVWTRGQTAILSAS